MAAKFVKGDKVRVIAGNSKGDTGVIEKIFSKENKALVTGVNEKIKHKKPTQDKPGEKSIIRLPIDLSNLSHIEDGMPIKIRFETDQDGKKNRVSRKTGQKISFK